MVDLVAMGSPNGAKSQNFDVLIGRNYETMLKESIERFLDEFQRGISDFSGFGSIFFRLLQARVDPPLETIWFYSAVSFPSSKSTEDDSLKQVFRTKDLFQLLSACSSSCSSLKSIAVMAPVLFELNQSVVELLGKKDLSLKREKKTMREIECLIEGIVGYISICAINGSDGEDSSVGLLPCFADLVHVWTIGKSGRNKDIREVLRVFFPLVSDEIRDGFGEGEIGVDYLAGVVILEAFLLSLCLKFRGGLAKSELEKELKTWAVGSITAFRNCYFFVIVYILMLCHEVRSVPFQDSEDEALLRKVLYDVVILVEYSFLSAEGESGPSADFMKNLAITRLIVVHEATQAARSNRDQTKAISYMNAFSRSRLPSQLIKWASKQIGVEQKASKLNLTTPKTLIKWLLNLENQGVQVFGLEMSKLRAKVILDMSKVDYEDSVFKSASKEVDEDLFYIDTKGGAEEVNGEDDQEMVDSMDATFLAAAHTMKFTENDRRRKRKEGKKGDDGTKVKFQKHGRNGQMRWFNGSTKMWMGYLD
ncbi:hypothetical protein BVC80_41g74 [Macleaya cordata]|uniref:Uncharacterized protein n=1 Tax=Macleaya cordata TaxID=56857 RepID=A0A200QMW2_MACCD|nr:hypothetical protein BVC80_41g74 [Macleaya cordata]